MALFAAAWANFMNKGRDYTFLQVNRLSTVKLANAPVEQAALLALQAAWTALDPIEKAYYTMAGGPNLAIRYGATTGFGKAQWP